MGSLDRSVASRQADTIYKSLFGLATELGDVKGNEPSNFIPRQTSCMIFVYGRHLDVLNIRELGLQAYANIEGVTGKAVASKMYKIAIAEMQSCQKERIPYAERLASFYWRMLSYNQVSEAVKAPDHEEMDGLRQHIFEVALQVIKILVKSSRNMKHTF